MHSLSSLRAALWLSTILLLGGCGDTGAPSEGGAAGDDATVATAEIDTAEIDAYRARVLPDPEERRWEEMDWIATYADGLRAASDEQKPLLLYVMNGHPLGCT